MGDGWFCVDNPVSDVAVSTISGAGTILLSQKSIMAIV